MYGAHAIGAPVGPNACQNFMVGELDVLGALIGRIAVPAALHVLHREVCPRFGALSRGLLSMGPLGRAGLCRVGIRAFVPVLLGIGGSQ